MAYNKGKIQYKVKVDKQGFEVVRFGAMTPRGRCAQLVRFGSPKSKFILSKKQESAVRKGKRVNVTTGMIEAAHYHCPSTTLLGDAKRRRRKGR